MHHGPDNHQPGCKQTALVSEESDKNLGHVKARCGHPGSIEQAVCIGHGPERPRRDVVPRSMP